MFEFGASWCAPCKVLEPKLAALVKQYPRTLAIRRIDVVDQDSDTSTAYLVPGNFALPHIKVKDRSGTLVLEKSGDLDGIVAAVRALAQP